MGIDMFYNRGTIGNIVEQISFALLQYGDVYCRFDEDRAIVSLWTNRNFDSKGGRTLKEYGYVYIFTHSTQEIIRDMLVVRELELL